MMKLLSAQNITKRFGAVTAVNNVSFDLDVGEVVGLIGQNGSGKTSLLRAIGGFQPANSGTIRLRGEIADIKSPLDAVARGVGMVHQEQSLIPNLTVAENIFLDKPVSAKRHGWYNWRQLRSLARFQLEKVSADIDPGELVGALSFAERQLVEFAKVMALEEFVDGSIVVLFDEPTSLLAPEEVQRLFRLIRRIRARAACVFVSHRLDEVLEISDRVLVMVDGNKVAERVALHARNDELFELMVGRSRETPVPRAYAIDTEREPMRLSVRNLTSDRFRDVTFDVRRGEILGIAGVMGSGAEDLCRAIFGVESATSGQVVLDGEDCKINSPMGAVESGIGYLPSDRRGESLLSGMSVIDNIVLTYGQELGWGYVFINRKAEIAAAAKWSSQIKVKRRSLFDPVDSLSGGNQQKIVLGKWLLSKRLKVLLLDHPTRGLDLGAVEDLFDAIRNAAIRGLSVVLIGDTVPELIALSHSIIVMRDGVITSRFLATDAPTEKQILEAMI
ncbi:MAG: sugar ABC transporter ATP-binding protein [Beijerinckiaceae bacterium]